MQSECSLLRSQKQARGTCLNQMNLVHTVPPCISEIEFSIILPL
jgi:hypothetical protein